MAGLSAGKAGSLLPVGWLLALALFAAMLALHAAWRAPGRWAWAVSAALFFAGGASYALHRERISTWEELPPREARLALRIDRVFTQTDPKKASGLATVVRGDAPLSELAGQKLYFSLALQTGQEAPIRSAIISTLGVLATLPENPPSNSFDAYLASAGMNFRLSRGRMLAEERSAGAYQRFCAKMAGRFSTILGIGVAEKNPALVAVLRAMMLGQQGELSAEQDQLFMQSGTMHMFSISGLHVAVIAGGLQALLGLMRLPRVLQFLFGVAALWLYVGITGAAPSAVRAFIMVAALQTSLLLRVPGNPFAALTASAAVILLIAPMQIFSASFQMSYGIVAALLLLGLPLAERWSEQGKLFALLPKAARPVELTRDRRRGDLGERVERRPVLPTFHARRPARKSGPDSGGFAGDHGGLCLTRGRFAGPTGDQLVVQSRRRAAPRGNRRIGPRLCATSRHVVFGAIHDRLGRPARLRRPNGPPAVWLCATLAKMRRRFLAAFCIRAARADFWREI
jgi:competence protein ComEC